MHNWESTLSWQELLGKLIEDPQAKLRLAIATEVRTITLERWAKRISQPQEKNVLKLLRALAPPVSTTFFSLLTKDFPTLAQAKITPTQIQRDVPSEFYARLLQASAELPSPLRHQILLDLLLQQALTHLDPERRGMLISLIRFVRPLDGRKVRSLREVSGVGTPPWRPNLEQPPFLLGAESLAGYALGVFHRVVVPNRTDLTLFPVRWAEPEQSVVAVPITLHERVAGCLRATSHVPDYFVEGHSPVRIVERYAQLASLIFDPVDFLDPDDIHLGCMPSDELQMPYVRDFHRLVAQQLRLALVRGGSSTLEEARQQAWREIEEALLQVFLQTESLT